MNNRFAYDSHFPKGWSAEITSGFTSMDELLWVLNCENPRCILDHGSEAWKTTDMPEKRNILRVFTSTNRLDKLLAEYIRRCRQHAPEYLEGLGPAILAYADDGFILRLPATPMVGNISGGGFPASLARLVEDRQLDTDQDAWLRHELRRLRKAIDHCLKPGKEA